MAEPALRTRIRVRFPEGTVLELDRDPQRAVGDLIPASCLGAYWAGHSRYMVKAKHVDPGSDITPADVCYEVETLGAMPPGEATPGACCG